MATASDLERDVPGSGDEWQANFCLILKVSQPIRSDLIRSRELEFSLALAEYHGMLCTETMTVRVQDHHGGKDHGGGNKRSSIYALLLLIAYMCPFRCVVRASCPLF